MHKTDSDHYYPRSMPEDGNCMGPLFGQSKTRKMGSLLMVSDCFVSTLELHWCHDGDVFSCSCKCKRGSGLPTFLLMSVDTSGAQPSGVKHFVFLLMSVEALRAQKT